MGTFPSSYINFPVHETIDLKEVSDIRRAVDKMVEAYEYLNQSGNFELPPFAPQRRKIK